ncbi:MAG TPA: DUF1232 domain-containing protein, partial [Caulobacteraceae bacterium]|nr:DUF1232 domain-containing protein [Caulobacteraceae bacterium]
STFLTDVIAELPGFHRAVLVPAFGRREQELDEACLRREDRFNYVAQNHVQYSDWTAQMCGDYGVAPVVLVRSLLDAIVSLRDHLRNEGPGSPIFYVNRQHASLDDARLELLIARLALPWYLGFYMSWRQSPDALMINYEDLAAHPREVIGKVLAFSGAGARPEDIEAAIARVQGAGGGRMNVGVAGRGRGLKPDVLRAVLELIDFYPEAAEDPYIVATRAECLAALAGAPAAVPVEPPTRPAHKPRGFAPIRRWWRRNAERVVMRGLIPLALLGLAISYWFWPNDLIPDNRPWGYADDIALLLAAGLIAGRLTAYKPHAPRPRR